MGLSSTTVTSIEFGEKTQIKGYFAIQGHRFQYQPKAHMRLPISD